MTVHVTKSAKTIEDGILNMKDAMIFDYQGFMPETSEVRTRMNKEYAEDFEVKHGKKYIKILCGYSCTAFVVAVDDDVRFRKGDILKPAGYNAPARNAARGNILDGGYPINWTGPLYL